MKHRIYHFKQDTDNSDDVDLYTTREELAAAIEEAVENYSFDKNEGRAALMRQHPFESTEWMALWEDFKDEQTSDQNYFAYGEQELDLPDPPTLVPRVVVIVEGGLVSHALSDAPVEVLVIDYDTDGTSEPNDIVQVPQSNGTTEPALFLPHYPLHSPDTVHKLFNLQRPCPNQPSKAPAAPANCSS